MVAHIIQGKGRKGRDVDWSLMYTGWKKIKRFFFFYILLTTSHPLACKTLHKVQSVLLSLFQNYMQKIYFHKHKIYANQYICPLFLVKKPKENKTKQPSTQLTIIIIYVKFDTIADCCWSKGCSSQNLIRILK